MLLIKLNYIQIKVERRRQGGKKKEREMGGEVKRERRQKGEKR